MRWDAREPWTLEKQGPVFLPRALTTRRYESFPQASTTTWPQMGVNGEDGSSGQTAEADSQLCQRAPDLWMSAWDADGCCFFFFRREGTAAPPWSLNHIVVQHVLQQEEDKQIYVSSPRRGSSSSLPRELPTPLLGSCTVLTCLELIPKSND